MGCIQFIIVMHNLLKVLRYERQWSRSKYYIDGWVINEILGKYWWGNEDNKIDKTLVYIYLIITSQWGKLHMNCVISGSKYYVKTKLLIINPLGLFQTYPASFPPSFCHHSIIHVWKSRALINSRLISVIFIVGMHQTYPAYFPPFCIRHHYLNYPRLVKLVLD